MSRYYTEYILEVCIDSVESAIASQQGGASRVELCDNLFEGGTTPSAGIIQVVRKNIEIDLNVMIRPRGGDFLYSAYEFEVMKADIIMAKELGANGVVFGLLNADGSIDTARSAQLIELAKPLSVTFHRAFDMVSNPMAALNDLLELKVDRLLTSGLEATAYEGADLIAGLVNKAKNALIIMPGGGISEKNIAKIANITQCKEFHVTGRTVRPSGMSYHKEGVYMGGELRMSEFLNYFTDTERIRSIKGQL
jgi:copper homeostasis protein